MFLRITTLTVLLLATQIVNAQTGIVCSSVATDPDGDGYGWENNQSCRVTTGSDSAPQFINLETGQPAALIRAFWNPEDFESSRIVCEEFYFNGSDYTRLHVTSSFTFSALSRVAPFDGTVERTDPFDQLPDDSYPWSLNNGVYTGPTRLGETPWLEVLEREFVAGFSPPLFTPFVRVWASDSSYSQCRPVNPNASFIPTGMAQTTETPFDGTCIDTDPMGDGWGWDGTASCRIDDGPSVISDCVDTVPLNDGWGWNGVTSCRV